MQIDAYIDTPGPSSAASLSCEQVSRARRLLVLYDLPVVNALSPIPPISHPAIVWLKEVISVPNMGKITNKACLVTGGEFAVELFDDENHRVIVFHIDANALFAQAVPASG